MNTNSEAADTMHPLLRVRLPRLEECNARVVACAGRIHANAALLESQENVAALVNAITKFQELFVRVLELPLQKKDIERLSYIAEEVCTSLNLIHGATKENTRYKIIESHVNEALHSIRNIQANAPAIWADMQSTYQSMTISAAKE